MDKIKFSEDRMMGALKRSGYLFESEMSKLLSKLDYFVESNKIIKDKFTGKGREIDLIAEFNEYQRSSADKCYSKSKLVFEIKNISAPLCLITEFQNSPNVESWYAVKEYITQPKDVEYYPYVFSDLMLDENPIFTQYCSFQEKKEKNAELMALHPENIYQGLQKIVQYCDEKIGDPNVDHFDEYFRHFYYIPVLLVSDDLYEVHLTENNPIFKKVDSSILMYNYQSDEKPNLAYVFVVTQKGLLPFLAKTKELEEKTEKWMIGSKKRSVK